MATKKVATKPKSKPIKPATKVASKPPKLGPRPDIASLPGAERSAASVVGQVWRFQIKLVSDGSKGSFFFGFQAEGSQRGWVFEQQGAAFLMEKGKVRYVGEIVGNEMSGNGGNNNTLWTFTAKLDPRVKKPAYKAILKGK